MIIYLIYFKIVLENGVYIGIISNDLQFIKYIGEFKVDF